ncbi:MAG: zinc-ribbon domain-containing protein [Myxococcota bacterium]
MIVRCANCHTEFSLEDQQIGPEGATVRCSVCGYVFPVEPPQGTGEHPWQIRTVEDLLFTAPDLNTLRMWIEEGRLHPDDMVSRTGRHWLRLGDMPEFSDVFSGFSDLPQVYERVDPAENPSSAIDELGPPPSFGGTMPVVQGVDTDILVVDTPGLDQLMPSATLAPAVEPESERTTVPPEEPEERAETSGPMPFPMAEVGIDSEELEPEPELSPEEAAAMMDESAVRLRPRPYTPTARVDKIAEVSEQAPVEPPPRPAKTTLIYGADEVPNDVKSMLESVTNRVDADAEPDETDEPEAKDDDEEEVPVPVRPREPDAAESAQVRSSAIAVERPRVSPREPSGPKRSRREPAESSKLGSAPGGPRRRQKTFARDIAGPSDKPPRRTWPWVAGLGLLAGVAVVFGVPSIRTKVLDFAGQLAGKGDDEVAKLEELDAARSAMASLDPVALGEAEAALQARLDAGGTPASGVAAMKLAQVELLSTRAIDHALGAAVGVEGSDTASDDVERATRILGSVVVDDVADRTNMTRVRARMRLAQGRPAAEILPLLPEDGSGELRPLVDAAPLWRDPAAALPDGVIAGLEGLPERSALAQLTLAVAYKRAGDEAKARTVAQAVLDKVPGQPTAMALVKGGAAGSTPSVAGTATAGTPTPAGTGAQPPPKDSEGGAETAAGSTTGGSETAGDSGSGGAAESESGKAPAARKPKTESVDSLIGRGCDAVDSGDVKNGLELLRKAKARRPGDLDLQLCMGLAQAKQGRTGQALESFEKILRKSPSFAPAVRQAAKAAAKMGQTSKAVGHYRKLLELRPRDPTALAYVEKHG